MVLTREQVVEDIKSMSDQSVQRVAEFVAFVKFQERFTDIPTLNEAELARLYDEAADEDVELAEAGMADYAATLDSEDKL